MRASRVSRGLLALFVCLMMLTPMAVAQDKLEWYVEPDNERAETIEGLFNGVFLVGLFVFVFVEALIIYIIWRFRHNRTTPQGENHRGHTKAEVMWTIIPAVILIIIGIASVSALQEIDVVPEDTDATVNVTANQFLFTFEYEDGSTSNNLVVREGARVKLQVTSVDVIHAFWVPEFALKIDAVPGRINEVWFEAPEVNGENLTLWVQCAEYCGNGHHSMGWGSKVIIYDAEACPDCPVVGEDLGPVETDQVTMEPGNIFAPQDIVVDVGTTVTWTNDDSVPHTVTPDDKAQWGTDGSGDAPNQWLSQGQTFQHTFSAEGTYSYHCIPHATQDASGKWIGMIGTVNVRAAGGGNQTNQTV